ncbi:5-hydroxytryptamine receptor 1A-alpha-like [Babylonia areolata]|uniref:5-hydroxytryptamine receptor 1A-alpha-like n=1 Tax=Babylonia areolata TaxID=304850 RepID=UPI003FD0BBD3
MTAGDTDQSKARVKLISEMQKLVVFQLASSGDRDPKDSAVASVNMTAAVHPVDGYYYPQWNFSIINITITVFASLVIFCTVSGNALVIVAVIKERRLRKVSNSFIINLAVSDVLVGVLVTPIALLYQLHGHWVFSRQLCHVWVSMDVICCTASITSLCAISYDRYNAITSPLRYARRRTRRRAFYLILVIWIYSACIALPPFVGWGAAGPEDETAEPRQCSISQHPGYTLYSTIGAFYLPLSFMLFAYVCIYRETSKRTRQWRCGPGSSKMISERNRHRSVSIPLAPLAVESEAMSSPARCSLTPSPSRTDSTRMSSDSALFLRNSSMASCRVIHRDSIILEEEESIRKEGSSGCSHTNASPALLQTIAQVNGTCKTTLVTARKLDYRSVRRTYGSILRKPVRQISSRTSSDSSTATTSSLELLPTDQSPLKLRFSPARHRQNTDVLLTSRQELVIKGLGTQEESIRYAEDSLKSVNCLASPSHQPAHGPYENHFTTTMDSSPEISPIAKCSRGCSGVKVATHRRKMSVSQEKRAAKTLSVVLGAFIVCWFPFFLVALLKPLCVTCSWPGAVDDVVLWLGYFNSALNPIIYTFFNKDFRFAFRNILCCVCRRRRRRRHHYRASL